MKIHIDGFQPNSHSGPNTFISRLAKQLFVSGHEVCFNSSNADVSLVLIEPTGMPLAKNVCQRLDGFWFKASEYETKNVGIKRLYENANGVIFQSEFDKTFITKFWGAPQKSVVIGNGILCEPRTQCTLPALAQIREKYKMMFVCSANWHAQKRLSTNINLFKHIRSTIEPSSCLLILGNNPDCKVADVDIFYAGSLSENEYLEIYSWCNWMLHTAFCDHSPNVVVEALSQGTPIICVDSGGTKELVRDFGIVLKEKEEFAFNLCDYDNPPNIDVTQLKLLPDKIALGKSADINIETIANRYVEFLKNFCS